MKLIKFSVLLVVSILWLGGCSSSLRQFFYQTTIVADDYRYGDLYRLSNLPQFKDPVTPCPPRNVPGAGPLTVLTDSTRTRTHLYIIGDSFTESQRLQAADLPVARLKRVAWHERDTIQLDPKANNVLLLESVERHFREHAANQPTQPIANFVVVIDTNGTNGIKQEEVAWGTQLVDAVRATGIEERLETILFSQPLFQWFREVKATVTLLAFGRVNPTVSLSPDRHHLFLALDTDSTKHRNAGTAPLSNSEVTGLVRTINETASRYQAAGFNRVVLSIIPNKATILNPVPTYNHLIERVQTHPALRVPFVDLYSLYRRQPQSTYALGDSHWTCSGRAVWLDAVAYQLGIRSSLAAKGSRQ